MTKDQFINDIPLDLAIRAHSGISWVPEKRGDSTREGYAEELAKDYTDLLALTVNHPEMRGTLDTEFARYREGYKQRFTAYLHSNSRCVSAMISGPSNFPARRMEKRNNIAHKRLNELVEYRNRALGAIKRALQPWLRPVMAGDSDAIQRLQAKIADAEAVQERMKACNAAIRKHAKEGKEAQVKALFYLGIDEPRAYKLLQPDFCGRIGFADFELTNNNANIRRMKQRLEGIERNHNTRDTEQAGDNATYHDCPAENRIRLFFPGKPDERVRSRLKSSGFRWTPTLGCWQAYRNPNTLEVARAVAGVLDGWQQRCAPEFVATITELANGCGKTADDVYRLWKEYSKNCESGDQCPVLGEFMEWYKEDLRAA